MLLKMGSDGGERFHATGDNVVPWVVMKMCRSAVGDVLPSDATFLNTTHAN